MSHEDVTRISRVASQALRFLGVLFLVRAGCIVTRPFFSHVLGAHASVLTLIDKYACFWGWWTSR